MTERERREGTGETKDNVGDDLDAAAGSGKDRPSTRRGSVDTGASGGTRENVEDELDEAASSREGDETGGSGGIKDNVRDDQDKTQRR